MPVPETQEIRRPLLESLDREEPRNLSVKDFLMIAARKLCVDFDDMSSIEKAVFKANVNDAKTYLNMHKLISNPSKQLYMITSAGHEVLSRTEGIIDDEVLRKILSEGSIEAINLLPEPPAGSGDSGMPEVMGNINAEQVEPVPDTLGIKDNEDEFSDDVNVVHPEQDAVPPENLDLTDDDAVSGEDTLIEGLDTTPPGHNVVLPENLGIPEDLDITPQEQDAVLQESLDMTDETQAPSRDNALTDNLDTTPQEQDAVLPENIDMTDETQTPSHDEALTDNLGTTPQEQDAVLPENLDLTDETQAPSRDNAFVDDLDTTPSEQDAVLPENLDLTDETQAPSRDNALVDDLDITPTEQDAVLQENLYLTDDEQSFSEKDELTESHQEYEVDKDMSSQEHEDFSQNNAPQPLELEDILAEHNSQLAQKLLAKAAALPSDSFEVFVTDLLSKMGYKAFYNARYTSSDTDNMINGVILDPKAAAPLYIHARKLSPDKIIGRSDVQDFVEALADKGGKGIFATTASFSDSASAYAQDERILLIDGQKLASLMISNNFCVNVEKVFEVKEIDEDSFNDYE